MATQHFLKELVSKPAYDRHGKQIPFEVFGGDYGGISLDSDKDKELIEDLAEMVGTMGISRTTQTELEKKKELPPWQPSNPLSQVRVFNPPKTSQPPQAPVGAAAVSAPITPLAPMPRTDGPAPALTQAPPPGAPKMATTPRVARPKVPAGVAATNPAAAA